MLYKLCRIRCDRVGEVEMVQLRNDHVDNPIPYQRPRRSISLEKCDRVVAWAVLLTLKQVHRVVAEFDIIQEVSKEVQLDQRF